MKKYLMYSVIIGISGMILITLLTPPVIAPHQPPLYESPFPAILVLIIVNVAVSIVAATMAFMFSKRLSKPMITRFVRRSVWISTVITNLPELIIWGYWSLFLLIYRPQGFLADFVDIALFMFCFMATAILALGVIMGYGVRLIKRTYPIESGL